ncbi:hypothetical protein EDC04DRAFT_2598501 [Pisolithus marmoratus]|nr:hypothetical protein EDC04DRAFT_2598501 [Pisolithus marmoratus]
MDIQNSGRVRDVPPLGMLKTSDFAPLLFGDRQTGVQDCMGNDKGCQLVFSEGDRCRRKVFLGHIPLEVSQLEHDPESIMLYQAGFSQYQGVNNSNYLGFLRCRVLASPKYIRIPSTKAARASEEVEEEFIAHLLAQGQ